MGLVITNAGADYSGLGLGFTDWVTEFLYRSGITDAGQKAAVRTLYNSAVSAGIWSKLGGVCFFPGATAATQKNIFRQDKGTLTFNGATTHDATGFTPNVSATSIAYADTGFALQAGVTTNFSMGVYNATAEQPIGTFGQRALMGVTGEATVAGSTGDHYLALARRWGGTDVTFGAIGQRNGINPGANTFPPTGTYDSTKTGFLQVVKVGTALSLLDNSTVISTATIGGAYTNPVGGSTRTLLLGATRNATGGAANSSSMAKQTFAYWGGLSVAEAQTWDGLVRAFLTAFGR